MNQLALPLTRKGRKLARPPAPKEHAIHIAVVQHLRTRAKPGWYWFHPANGEHRDKRTAAKLKAMGVQAGIADLLLIAPDGTLHALELKRRGGVLSEAQRDFAAICERAGCPYSAAYDLDEALRILDGWGALKPSLYVREQA
jgi:hypothetical protein